MLDSFEGKAQNGQQRQLTCVLATCCEMDFSLGYSRAYAGSLRQDWQIEEGWEAD